LDGDPSDSPLFNRSVQGVYELGSTFKIFTAVQALELGLVNADTMIDTKGPMRVGGHSIGEFAGKNYGTISVSQIIEKSSNRGTGRLALMIGKERQQEFLRSLGLFEKSSFEIIEASGSTPLLPKRYTDLSAVTISYGHGISTTAMHLAAGYAAIANGGRVIKPTLLRQNGPKMGERVMRPEVAAAARQMLRDVVAGENGTATFGEVPGYFVAGKTGTADKPRPRGGGYYKDKTITTFASMFPADNPRYVLVVTLDEPSENSGEKPRRTAGWTAVPIAAEMIRRVAPLLGMRPAIEPSVVADITLTSSN
jgi:cell division protein FtsI (penicillin-binding protein 3)